MALAHFDRETFIGECWDYAPGDHVTILCPTGGGKTTWTNRLMLATATRQMPAVVLATKPKDSTMDELTAAGFKRVKGYSGPKVAGPRPQGFVVWPDHEGDPAVDDPAHRAVFRRALLADYGAAARHRGVRRHVGPRPRPVILNVDEIFGVTDLGLAPVLATLWTRGRSVGCGLWGGSQRPYDVPQYAYSQPNHLFLGWTPDKRDRLRFREIGGMDQDLILYEVAQLQPYEWLYVNRMQRAMCVVGAE